MTARSAFPDTEQRTEYRLLGIVGLRPSVMSVFGLLGIGIILIFWE